MELSANKKKLIQGALAGALLSVQGSAMAVLSLSLVPQGTTFFGIGQGSAQVTFNVQFSGLSPDDVVAGYDFGIAYDPTVMTLAAAGFGGFTDKLGNPNSVDPVTGLPNEVDNRDHLDRQNPYPSDTPTSFVNSVWDYTQPMPDPFGTFDSLNNPIPNGNGPVPAVGYLEGSLRFSQISLLNAATLLGLQDPATNNVLSVFTLTFNVNTSVVASTDIFVVNDSLYAGWTGEPDDGILDVKLNDSVDARYPNLVGSKVTVPLPATWMLIGLGLVGIRHFRRR